MNMINASKVSAKPLEEAIKTALLAQKPNSSVRVLSSILEISDLNPVGQKYRIVFEVQVTPLDKVKEPVN